MKNNFFLENEIISVTSDDGSILLTNQRVLKNTDHGVHAYFISMPLPDISTTEIRSKRHPVLIFLGVICLAAGITAGAIENEVGMIAVGGFLFLIFILLYIFTRHHSVHITSNGGSKLYFRTKGMRREAVLDFVRKIEQAKSLVKGVCQKSFEE